MNRIEASVAALSIVILGACAKEHAVTCRATTGVNEVERWKNHLSLESDDGFTGAVLVAEGSNMVLTAEYGKAGRDPGPSAHWIASISKTITAVAILRLVEEVRLDLHAPISSYLPEVPEQWKVVTVHHLLAHRSGFPHAYAADGIAERSEALRSLLALRPVKAVGEFSYSNDGYTLLAILVEILSGQSFESYVRSRILVPAAMEQTGFWGFEPDPTPVAPPHALARANNTAATIWRNGRSVPNWGYRGATGIYSTPEDLYRFVAALRDGRIIRKEAFAEMISSKNPSIGLDAQTYGYGWALRLSGGRLVEYWHGGNEDWLGHNGLLKVRGDRTYVVLTNSGDIGSGSWAHRIEEGLRACADQW